ncbi:hypothetical protein AM1BK_03610 [Neobacillus kokaensis]|uniref:Uncharacterized protein n=1 Tax=Neobacillus kokaensis TaxID=2759023 RepID=A0ABQ3MVX4_9BACI|nr:hypothetical protein AM1BK_03610 [Neobacillus kokaensis]
MASKIKMKMGIPRSFPINTHHSFNHFLTILNEKATNFCIVCGILSNFYKRLISCYFYEE